jgi:hypothetical protein
MKAPTGTSFHLRLRRACSNLSRLQQRAAEHVLVLHDENAHGQCIKRQLVGIYWAACSIPVFGSKVAYSEISSSVCTASI